MLNAIILGILQGITEFLPVSSSGHLVLIQSILPGFAEESMIFDVALHFGTLISVLLYFSKDWIDLVRTLAVPGFRSQIFKGRIEVLHLMLALIIATIPAGIAGVLLEDKLEEFFSNPIGTSFFLMGTGVILLIGERINSRYRSIKETPLELKYWFHWLCIGLAQTIALLPGISRSGSTMSAAIALGWKRTDAARFSFFLMIPAISGAVLLKTPAVIDMISCQTMNAGPIIIGVIISALTGTISIYFLMKFLQTRSFMVFSIYCFIAGAISAALYLF